MIFSRGIPLAILLLGLSGLPGKTQAQNVNQEVPGCDAYEDCALRVQYRLFRTEIVRGMESNRVARIGLGTPPLDEILSRSRRATVSFEGYREDHRRSSWLTVLGGIEIMAGLVARAQDKEDWAVALSISGVLIEVGARIFNSRANEHLSEAVWWYNESLVPKGAR